MSAIGSAAAAAEPRTLYKPQDIENARRNVKRHGWAQRIASAWEKAAAPLLKQDRKFFEDETRPEWSQHRYHYDLRIEIDGRLLYVETILVEDDPEDSTVHVVSP